jgi:hypothetical protein
MRRGGEETMNEHGRVLFAGIYFLYIRGRASYHK